MKAIAPLVRTIRKPWVIWLFILLATPLTFHLAFLNYTEPTEVGIARNPVNGETWIQKEGGWHFTMPWVRVAVVDARPMRVRVESAGHGWSAKLVQFDPGGWQEFVAVEGFRYYWWANRFSFNWGYQEEHRGVKDILRGHSNGTKKYTIIKVLTEYR